MGRPGDSHSSQIAPQVRRQETEGLIARLVPNQLRSTDPRGRSRAMNLTRASLLGSALSLLLVPYLARLQQTEAALLSLSLSLGLALTAPILRRSRSVKTAAHWSLGCTFVILLVGCARFGGVSSPTFPWLATLPIAGIFFAGRRAGLLWTAVSTLAILGLGACELADWIVGAPYLTDKLISEETLTMASLSLALAGLAWLAEARSNRIVRQLEQERRMFRTMSMHDFLTGLANRSLVDESLARSWERCRRADIGGALFFVDLNGFKAINDTRGHAAGDHVLREVARRLRTLLRRSDLAGRIGGDEFALVVEGLDSRGKAAALADKIARVIETPIELQGGPVQVGASIGIALYPDPHLDADEPGRRGVDDRGIEPGPIDRTRIERLFRQADTAMYTAKRRRQRYWIHGEPEADRRTGRMRKVIHKPREAEGSREPVENESSSTRSVG